MSRLRRQVIPFVVVAMALAVGIALGAGPLSDLGSSPPKAAAEPQVPQADPAAEDREAYDDAFAGTVAQSLYAGRLHGHAVVLVTLPGADDAVVGALTDQVRAAGTRVIGTYGLRRTMVDARQKTLVDTLGSQLVTQLGSDVVTADATTYDRIGQLLGRAIAMTTQGSALDQAKVASLRASLHGAGLLALPEGEPGLAPLVLLVTGKAVEQPVLDGLASGLAGVAKGVVV
ncbi:MAG: copper transporter, partial [Nocardioides sp.]